MSNETLKLDELDRLATEAFPGLVVRKDLLRRMHSAFSVPAFVIEFLLGKYCASTDEEIVGEGLGFVRETLEAKYVKPDEREAVKSSIKQHTSYEIIDKISVRLVETHDKYWARLSNLNLDFININDGLVHEHDRLLMCCSARGLRADRHDKLLKLLDTGGQNCTPNNSGRTQGSGMYGRQCVEPGLRLFQLRRQAEQERVVAVLGDELHAAG